MTNFIRRIIKKLGKNASLNILPQPLFSIPFYLYSPYSTLYMMKLGISGVNVGILNSITFITRSISALFVAYIINKLGRKKSLLLFDIIAWVIPYFILSYGTNVWHFFIASAISGTGIVNGVAWNCYIVEDVKPQNRIFAFNILEIITIVCGVIAPVTGAFINYYSLLPTIRSIYLLAAVCMIIWVLLRIFFMTETSVGKKTIEIGQVRFKEIFPLFWRTFKIVINQRSLILLFSVSIIINFCTTIYNLYYMPYLTLQLNYSESGISAIPTFISIVSLITLILIIPRKEEVDKLPIFGLFLYVIGTILLIIAPVKDSLIANTIDNDTRADVMGLLNILSSYAMFPIGIIAGILYGLSPKYPFVFTLALYILGLTLYLCVDHQSINERGNINV